jgi:hypothetical protein
MGGAERCFGGTAPKNVWFGELGMESDWPIGGSGQHRERTVCPGFELILARPPSARGLFSSLRFALSYNLYA